MSKILAFTGVMGSGKSTAIKILTTYSSDRVYLVKFAAPLYDIQEYIYERVSSVITRDQSFIKDRKLLQWIGTEWGRSLDSQLWTKIWAAEVEDAQKKYPNALIVCDDVRFNNEAELVQSMGGKVIHIVGDTDRRNVAGSGLSSHSSESGVSDHLVSATIMNKGTIQDLKNTLIKVLGPEYLNNNVDKPRKPAYF